MRIALYGDGTETLPPASAPKKRSEDRANKMIGARPPEMRCLAQICAKVMPARKKRLDDRPREYVDRGVSGVKKAANRA